MVKNRFLESLGKVRKIEQIRKNEKVSLLRSQIDELEIEMKQTLTNNVKKDVDDMLTKIDLINDLLNEIEITLRDISTEKISAKLKKALFSSSKNYVRFVLKRLTTLKD